jgi:hypothetical protein
MQDNIIKGKNAVSESRKDHNIDELQHFRSVPNPVGVSNIASVSAYNFVISITMHVFGI